MRLSPNELHVLRLLTLPVIDIHNWCVDHRGKAWPPAERRLHGANGVRSQGRSRTLWALSRKRLVAIVAAGTRECHYEITDDGRKVLDAYEAEKART